MDKGLVWEVSETAPSADVELTLTIRGGRFGGLMCRSLDPPGSLVSKSWGAKKVLQDLPPDDVW